MKTDFQKGDLVKIINLGCELIQKLNVLECHDKIISIYDVSNLDFEPKLLEYLKESAEKSFLLLLDAPGVEHVEQDSEIWGVTILSGEKIGHITFSIPNDRNINDAFLLCSRRPK